MQCGVASQKITSKCLEYKVRESAVTNLNKKLKPMVSFQEPFSILKAHNGFCGFLTNGIIETEFSRFLKKWYYRIRIFAILRPHHLGKLHILVSDFLFELPVNIAEFETNACMNEAMIE